MKARVVRVATQQTKDGLEPVFDVSGTNGFSVLKYHSDGTATIKVYFDGAPPAHLPKKAQLDAELGALNAKARREYKSALGVIDASVDE